MIVVELVIDIGGGHEDGPAEVGGSDQGRRKPAVPLWKGRVPADGGFVI
jgi:hypothetical protein